ncbi:hypothetical protein ACEWPM_007880 [Roseovarius sp. S4756]|uniref:hypothetical protein n=1 Tax=Roseovarius maritimus TaxID=3342637 RepID=UPI00372793C2
MPLPTLTTDRFVPEEGLRIIVQVPGTHAQRITDTVLKIAPLTYGDYDCVTFRSAPGIQQFRSLGRGHNAATKTVVEVRCLELSFFLPQDERLTDTVLRAIYAAHPYEEPVIFVQTCLRTQHIRGMDEDNPARFWNSEAEDWIPQEHR